MKHRVLKIHPEDNVLVALQDLSKGETIQHDGKTYLLRDDVHAKHKFFMNDMSAGATVKMYGVTVGKTQTDVAAGGVMTTDNTKHAADPFAYRPFHYQWQPPDVSRFHGRTFNGYHRSDGRVGTANYWLFIPTVFCENRNLDVIREALHNELGYAVTDKYKQKAHQLLELYKSGADIATADLEIRESTVSTNRVFKNVDVSLHPATAM